MPNNKLRSLSKIMYLVHRIVEDDGWSMLHVAASKGLEKFTEVRLFGKIA